ncbi:MAG: IS5 family transposase [Woeseia sp.]
MPQIYAQRNQLKYAKKQYRARNCREYEAGLCKRGDLTIWFSEDALRDWHPPVGAKPGGQRRYSDTAIEAALTVRAVYGLASRQTEGFLRSVARLLQLDIEIPDHSTLSRRSSTLRAHVRNMGNADGPVHILIDSTGLKAHRGSTAPADRRNRRTWRKLPLVVDATTAEILTSKITTHGTRDSTPVRDLLAPINRGLDSVRADGANDRPSVYCAIEKHGSGDPTPTRILIPSGRNAKTSDHAGVESDQRDENICHIDRVGRRCWQRESGHTRRSLVETAVSRFKNEFGGTLGSRTMRSQVTEVRIACSILNTMTKLGMPDGYCVS